MKKAIISAFLLAAELFLLSGAALSAKTETTDVIVELNVPGNMDSYEYTLGCAEYLKTRLPSTDYGYIYDTLLNGFSLEIPESAIASLSVYGFIKNVYDVAQYEALSYEDSKLLSSKMVGITEEITNGLTGDGVKVAIIDNSFDVSHPAFNVSVRETLDLSEYAMKVGVPVRLNAMRYILDVQKFRYSSKIPYRFDYADHDTDVFDEANNHGTHVAGIIGAAKTYSDSMRGIAPECQMYFMKVFSDGAKTATDSAFIAALEDAVKLGADVINLSIGHYAGSTDMSVIGLDNIIAKAEESGCTIVCAAGNHGVTTNRSLTDLPLAEYTDYGTVSAPASADETIAVASVDNAVIFGEHFRHADDASTPFFFTDTNAASGVIAGSFNEHFNGKTLDYAIVPGIGEESDYDTVNVKGKLALIERGTITFAEKTNIAAKHGAIGVIIYNNVDEDEYTKMDLTGATIPAIFVSLEDGKTLIEKSTKKLKFNREFSHIQNTAKAGKISDFSSWGTTPSLTLKPDISAVGRSIYSTTNGGYGVLSGTSMASPQIAGMYALFTEKSRRDGTDIDITAALMNGAVPTVQSNGVEVSPRAQGAGLANLSSALSRKVEITHTSSGKPKAELFDKLGKTFTIDVTIKNLTNSPLDVLVSASLTSDGYTKVDSEYYSTLKAAADKKSPITVGQSGNLNRHAAGYSPLALTLDANETKEITLTFNLDDKYHEELAGIFTNGYYAEGYIYCESDGSVSSMPYMGYVGDFDAAPVLDADAYIGQTEMFDSTKLMVNVDGKYVPSGANIFTDPMAYSRDTIAFSPNNDGNADTLYFAATHLRNIKGAILTIRNEDGEIIRTATTGRQAKTLGKDETVYFYFTWDGSDGIHKHYRLPDGDYTFEVLYTLDSAEDPTQTYSYNVKLDTKAPTVTEINYTDGKLTIRAEDESAINLLSVYEGGTLDKSKHKETDGYATFDISDIKGDTVYYEIVDAAYNVLVGKLSLSKLTGKE